MQCPNCGASNPDNKKFCTSCGSSLRLRCPACDGENPPEAKFCGDCGASLAATAPTDVRQAPDTNVLAAPEAERRQLTVMFCDLVGSTALAERLDPEELREVLAQYQDGCADVIHRYEGHIARYVGDGLLVYFGYPQAHEDDAQRAVRTGLSLVDAIRDLEARIANPNVDLAVRIGIATGLVVAGDIGSGERVEEKAIVGETPNIAARLQGLAEPDTVLIGAGTRRLVEGLFDCDDLGEHRLKGISKPVAAYRVRTESGAPSRFEAKAARGLTPIVGRDEEVELLFKRWGRAKEGESQVVLLSGEAGIGKSRITRGLQERLREVSNRVLYYGSPYHQNSALYPVIDQLERVLRFDEDETVAQKLDKLEAALVGLDLPVEKHAPFLASLLSLPFNGRYPPLQLTPQELKNETFRILVSMIERMAGHDTVLMVVEDVHWIDPSTLELVTLLIEQLRSKRFLMLVTFRPEFESPWSGHAHVTALTLNRLSHKECATMVMKVTGGKALPQEVLEQIVAKTDGVPLFVEELTKNLLEAGLFREQDGRLVLNGPLPTFAIPTSLQDSLMARLDRLIAEAKNVAQLAATLGRTFGHELLAAVAQLKESTLSDSLAELVTAGLVYRRGLPSMDAYEFKHALVRDAAYQSLLKSTRQDYHQRIANVLEERFPQIVQTQPELLAHHYTEAQLPEQAIGYWKRAAEQAGERAGYVEALADLAKGLDLIKTLPDTPERTKEEFALYLREAEALHFLGQREEIVDLLLTHRERLEHLDDTFLAGQYYFWLGYAHSWLGNREEATRNLECSLEEATRSRDKGIMGLAHRALGLEYRYSGQLDNAVAHARKGMELLGQTKHWLWLGDAAYTLAFNYYWIGQFDLALEVARQLDTIGKTIGSRRFQTLGTMMTGVTLATRGECEAGIEACRGALELSPDPFETAVVLACLGRTYLEKRDIAQAVPVLEEAVKLGDQVRSKQWRAWFRTLLGEAYLLARRMVEAKEQVEQAIEISLSTKFPLGAGCARRVLGWIAQATGNLAEAQSGLDEATSIFRSTGAKFELARTCLSRAELSNAQGDLERVSAYLCEAYRLFQDLHTPKYVERTRQLASELGAAPLDATVQ